MNVEIKEVIDERFKILRTKMKDYMDQGDLPCGITLIYQNDEIISCEKHGMADVEKKIQIEFDSIFRIASMTKPIVSVAALMLYEEGKFSLDDPLSKFIPKAKDLKVFKIEHEGKFLTEELNREVTVRDVFTHTGGFSSLGDLSHPIDKKYSGLFRNVYQKSLAEVIDIFLDIPLKYQPGYKWDYGYSTDILGYLIEIISGIPLDEFLQERIFNKLGMKDTGFFVPEAKRNRLAQLYTKNNKRQLIKAPEDQQRYGRDKTKYISGVGGLVSTLSDYMKFTLMLLNNGKLGEIQILNEETIQLMTQDHVLSRNIPYVDEDSFDLLPKNLVALLLESSKGSGFGLGVRVILGDNYIPVGCHGWGGAFCTDYWVDPKNNIAGIFLSQVFPNFSFKEYYSVSIKKLVYEVLGS